MYNDDLPVPAPKRKDETVTLTKGSFASLDTNSHISDDSEIM